MRSAYYSDTYKGFYVLASQNNLALRTELSAQNSKNILEYTWNIQKHLPILFLTAEECQNKILIPRRKVPEQIYAHENTVRYANVRYKFNQRNHTSILN